MKKWILLIIFWRSCTAVYGQTPLPTVRVVDEMVDKPAAVRYYDEFWEPLPGAAGAHCYDQFVRVDSAGLNWRGRRYVVATGQLILEQYFIGPVPGVELAGHSREWYETGQLREDLAYHRGRVVGVLHTYYPDGKPHRTEFAAPAKGTAVCLDSTGHPLAKCPPYHIFAQMRGKNTYSGKFLKVVQQQYAGFLPSGYNQPKELVLSQGNWLP